MKIESKLKIKLFYCLLTMILFSCKDENEEVNRVGAYNKMNNQFIVNNEIFNGQFKDSVPYGIWSFKNEDGDDVLQIKFTGSIESVQSYSLKQFNSKGKVIYYNEYFSEGKNAEIDVCCYNDLNNVKIGSLIYNTHIKNYILLRKDYKKIYGDNGRLYLKSILDSLKHNNIKYPDFSKNEIDAILIYLDDMKKPRP